MVKNISESVAKKATKGRYCSAELFFFLLKLFFVLAYLAVPCTVELNIDVVGTLFH